MKRIEVSKQSLNLKDYLLKPVTVPPPDTLIVREDATITCAGEVIAGFRIIREHDFADIKAVLKRLKYQKTERTGGLPTNSRIFGCAPRLAIRKDFCAKCQLEFEDPSADSVLKYYGTIAESVYGETNPDIFHRHMKLIEGIKPEWRMGESIWTQGIVNWNNQLRFHRDRGNFDNTWNAMFTFKKDIDGGMLYFPEYKMAFELADGSVSTFNGQGIVHGVTPIRLLHRNSFRYTIVYYSLAQMTKCLSVKEELNRIRSVKTKRERARV